MRACEPQRFTNINDVTQDYARTRALSAIAPIGLQRRHVTLCYTRQRLRRDLRTCADYLAVTSMEKAEAEAISLYRSPNLR